MDCKLKDFRRLQHDAFDFVQYQFRKAESLWPTTAVLLDWEQFSPCVPEQLRVLGESWRRVPIRELKWSVGFGYNVPIPNLGAHMHADLVEHGVHLDLFRFVSWGPLSGVTGILVWHDELLGAGGRWHHPPAGGSRNWPLAVALPTGALLTVSGSVQVMAEPQSTIEVVVWERDG